MPINIEPIAKLISCYKQPFGTPRQPQLVPSSYGNILLNKKIVSSEALEGLEGFDYLWITFIFHKKSQFQIKGKVKPPRLEGKKMGWMATRTPHRPNSLGLSLVKLVDIKYPYLEINGIDMIDNTPILDIKPYLSYADQPLISKSGWTENLIFSPKKIEWKCPVPTNVNNKWKETIENSLRLDPRPHIYKKSNKWMNNQFKMCLDNIDVTFTIKEDNVIISSTLPFNRELIDS